MKKGLLLFVMATVFYACSKKSTIQLHFLDEYVIADSIKFKNSLIGGLSGIDFYKNNYYLIVDDARNPRFLKAKINIKSDTISSINFKDVITLSDTTTTFYKENALDLESIFVDENTGNVNFVSEGSINKGKKPSVFTTDFNGNFVYNYTIPEYFIPNKQIKIKHNGVFEGSSKSVDGKGFWVAMEAPLLVDGNQPTFKKTSSPVRITYFDNQTKKATSQFAYQLDYIERKAKGNLNVNGVTSILEYEKNKFFVVERTYQSGFGTSGNVIKIYDVVVEQKTTNTLNINALKETDFSVAKKRLLLNFNDVKDQFAEKFVDNIEGITFGPKLSNGNQSLILVSDDNFQKYGKQLNQFILLEIKRNN